MTISPQQYQRVEQEPAYILHSYPYSESSLMVEVFTNNHGRIVCLAKGAKRPYSTFRGALQTFQPLRISWSGRTEIKTLRHVEWQGGIPLPRGEKLLVGFYLNELLLKLLPREDAHPNLFSAYHQTLKELPISAAPTSDTEWLLRQFEILLLRELGYALNLTMSHPGEQAIQAERYYHYHIGQGLIVHSGALPQHSITPSIRGETLLALVGQTSPSDPVKGEARRFMRYILDHHLENQDLASRQVWRDLQGLEVAT